ncbi:MAG: amino acid permease [Candidatus Woesearchaeota archaeon]|nr:amino acid permease [Candidatus Woesearchaeota archaeon]
MAELKRSLGFITILALSISSMVGTGLFIGPALGAYYAGNASLIAWIIMSVVSIYIALCFSELVSLFPKAGGVYEFAKQTYGRFTSFLVGWTAWLTENITTTLLIVTAINYLTPTQFPLIYKIIISLIFIIILNIIAYLGLEASSATMIFFAAITVGLVSLFVILSFFHLNIGNFSPFFTKPPVSILITIFFIAETFFGWEAATYLAEETKNPEKAIPRALLWSTAIMGVVGVLTAFALLGVFSAEKLSTFPAPINNLSLLLFGRFGDYISGIGVYLILIGSAASGIIAGPRLILALARDKLFPSGFAKIHEKYKTPYKAVIFQTVVSIIVVFLAIGLYEKILSLLVPLVILMYILIILAIPILRIKKANLRRTFKVPFAKIGTAIISLFFLAIILSWLFSSKDAWNSLFTALSLLALGIPLYFLLELYYDPGMIRKIEDAFAYLTLWTEKLSLPLSARKQIISIIGSTKGKTMLEFGCNVGTLTMHLAEEVGKDGRIYATDISERDLRITGNRLRKKGHKHVTLIHDPHHAERVHPNVPKVDVVVSVGMLSYVQKVKNVLMQLNKRMKKGDKICFVEYDKFFYIIPTKEWIRNNVKIKEVFRDSGFNVAVIRKGGLFWEYVYIYGVKERNVVS